MFKKIKSLFRRQDEVALEEKVAFVLDVPPLFAPIHLPALERPILVLEHQPVFTLHNLDPLLLPADSLQPTLPERRLEALLGSRLQQSEYSSKRDLRSLEETKRSRPWTEEYHNPAPKSRVLSHLYRLAPALWLKIYQYLDPFSQLQFNQYDHSHYLGCSSLLGNEGLDSRSPVAVPKENYKVYNDDPRTGFFMR